jgi:hypothetical protein
MSHAEYLNYLDILFFYKAKHCFVDSNITDAVFEGRLIRGQDGIKRLIPPRARTTMYQKGFLYRTTNALNDLPSHVKTAPIAPFKSALKLHILSP